MAMFSGFRAYDDEGYYLANLNDYLSGHPLLSPYAQVYGPFFYEVLGGLFKLLGIAPDNDSGRWLTAAVWVIAALAAGLVVFGFSRNLWLGLGAQVLTFSLLSVLSNEPLSTYGMSTLLLLGLTAASFGTSRPRLTAALIGAIVGALCLVKVNVGGFAALAVAFAWAAGLTSRWRQLFLPAMTIVITTTPLLIVSSLLTTPWVFELGVVVALSAAAIGAANLGVGRGVLAAPPGRWIAAGGAALVVATLAIALASGTRPADAWNGLVVLPLRFPRLFTVPIRLNFGYDVVAIVSFVAALVVSVRRWITEASPAAAGVIRIGAGFFMWLSMLFMPDSTFLLALPLAWVSTWAPKDGAAHPVDPYARRLLPALAVLESLQTYPIAGSQLSVAALGLVPLGAITLLDGIRQLESAAAVRGVSSRLVGLVAPAALVLNVAVLLLFALTVTAGFKTGTPLGVRGAQSVRLPVQQATQLRELVAAVDRECSSFVTFPGMNSFYIWTAQHQPTPVRAEVWWLVLDNTQQQGLVEHLTSEPRLCVIKNQSEINMWAQGRPVPRGPLVDFIDQGFVHDSSYGDYELLVRAGP